MERIVDQMTSQELGFVLRVRRKLLKLSQQELADLAEVSKPSIVAAEKGKPTLRLDVLCRVAAALGLSLALAEAKEPE